MPYLTDSPFAPIADLRRHARALETALDSKLTSYSKLASSISRSGGARDELVMEEEGEGGYKLVEEEVEELIAKVRRAQPKEESGTLSFLLGRSPSRFSSPNISATNLTLCCLLLPSCHPSAYPNSRAAFGNAQRPRGDALYHDAPRRPEASRGTGGLQEGLPADKGESQRREVAAEMSDEARTTSSSL